MFKHVDLKVGSSCNNACAHCVASEDRNQADLSLYKIKNVIEEYISKYSQIDLTLTGGEITIREDYAQIMQFINEKKKAGFIKQVHLQTNGRRLSDNNILEATLSVVDIYLIALHSSNPAIHNQITNDPNSFDETTLALSKLTSQVDRSKIAIQTVISRLNYAGLEDTYKFVHEKFGIMECNITFPHPMGAAFDVKITPTYSEIKDSVNNAIRYCFTQGIKPFLEALPFCTFEKQFQFYAYKAYKSRNYGLVGYSGLEAGHIDYKTALANAFVKYESCQECELDSICTGVWKEYKQLYPLEDMWHSLVKV